MDKSFLLPHSWKIIGWIIFALSSLLGVLLLAEWIEFSFLDDIPVFAFLDSMIFEDSVSFSLTTTNLADELIALLVITGGLIVSFSSEKIEDEFIARIRLRSMSKAVVFNYFTLAFCILFFYGFAFYTVMIINMFATLYFYVISFHISLKYASPNVLQD
jgi:hypothetical protein